MLIVELEAPNGSGSLPPCFRGPRIAPATQAGSNSYMEDILFFFVLSGREVIQDAVHQGIVNPTHNAMAAERAA